MNNASHKGVIYLFVVIIVAVLAYGALTMKDQRSATDKIGDAIKELPQGVDKAMRQLEDRTPVDKLGDVIKDSGDKIQEQINP